MSAPSSSRAHLKRTSNGAGDAPGSANAPPLKQAKLDAFAKAPKATGEPPAAGPDTRRLGDTGTKPGEASSAGKSIEDQSEDAGTDQEALIAAAEEFDAHGFDAPRAAAAERSQANVTAALSRDQATASTSSAASGSSLTGGNDHLSMERQLMGKDWFSRLEPEMKKESFFKLKQYLAAERNAKKTIYPPEELIHSWSTVTPLNKVKVVILGQDPYHGPGQACGHSFSVAKGVKVPGSLKNIYKELGLEYGGEFTEPKHGHLQGWAEQGVLLLNACLTVQGGQAGSHHGKGWEQFTRSVLKLVADEATKGGAGRGASSSVGQSTIATMFARKAGHSVVEPAPGKDGEIDSKGSGDKTGESSSGGGGGNKGVVFLAWGQPAARSLMEAGITEAKYGNILILKSPHPSPLSAHRGFLGNGHFRKANEWLEARYGKGQGIDWCRLP